jgi:hypothetical protein
MIPTLGGVRQLRGGKRGRCAMHTLRDYDALKQKVADLTDLAL